MANEENIKAYQFGSTEKRTASEQRELKSKGGQASGASRRRKRDARKILEGVLKSRPTMDKETMKVTGVKYTKDGKTRINTTLS